MATKKQDTEEWERLQRKIFSRWVHQKLRNVVDLKDVVTGLADGVVLVQLMEILSEKKYTGKIEKVPKLRAHKLDNASNALKFTWECGVEMKMKPSAENLVDENVKEVLGLIWAIMSKYMKLNDEDGGAQQSIKDALLMWANNKTQGYKDVKVENFGSSWHDGLALCALLHKHRPQLLDFSKLSKENKKQNLQLAIDCAEKYFGLEKYLTPEDIPKLDEKSMVVYVSEYYYGFYEQRKLDIAAKRIGKVIKLTKDNDAMKKKYGEESADLQTRITKCAKLLEDRTIDNNMAGAKKRIEDFYNYKTTDKGITLGQQMDLEGLYNNLAMRLSYNNRPEYKPEISLKHIEGSIKHLEECERERSVALHTELNRQVRLVGLDGQHKARTEKLRAYISTKEAYLKTKEKIDSVSAAQLNLRLLDAFDKESKSVYETSVHGQLQHLGSELVHEKYERASEVQAREKEIEAGFHSLKELSAQKRPVLEDDLAREQFKAIVLLQVQAHADSYNKLHSWTVEKENYLKTKETIDSVPEAQKQLSILDNYVRENERQNGSVTALKQSGAEILAKHYKGKYSEWKYEHPDEIKNLEKTIDERWALLAKLSSDKRAVLDDDLAREEFKADTLLQVQAFVDSYNKLHAWTVEKENYLRIKEVVDSVPEAQKQLSILDNYERQNERQHGSVVALHQHGSEILAKHFKGKFSEWKYEHPTEITDREKGIDERWALLKKLRDEKRAILDDHLAREQFKANVLLQVQAHIDAFNKLNAWTVEKENYLRTRETVDSIPEAQKHLSILDNYVRENERQHGSVVALKQNGAEILAKQYVGPFTQWRYPTPTDITNLEKTIDERWALLANLRDEKRAILDDHLAREQFKANVLLQVQAHADAYNTLQAWTVEKENYLKTKESIDSVPEAQKQLSILDNYGRENDRQHGNVVHLKSAGEDILSKHYKGKYSEWKYEHPNEITDRQKNIDARWELLAKLSSEKRAVLDDDLAREQFRASVLLQVNAHVDAYNKLNAWTVEKENYLRTKESINSIPEAQKQLSILDNYERENERQHASVVSLKSAGADILSKHYKGPFSEWKYPHPNEITDREKAIDGRWDLLAKLNGEKRTVLKADLEREIEKERLRVEFAHAAGEFVRWSKESSEDASSSHFGFTLQEVEAYEKTLQNLNQKIDSEANQRKSEYENIHQQMKNLNVTDNSYTSLTLDDLAKSRSELGSAQKKRDEAFHAELKRQRDNDKLCQDFAHIADPFSKFIIDHKDKVTTSKDTLENQLKHVEQRISSFDTDAKPLHDLKALDQKLVSVGITNNRHTTLTAKDVEVQWEQYKLFMEKKKKMLEEEIEHEKLKGVTTEQLQEISDNFNTFDADKSGSIDKKELKACLYSLGEEKKQSEVEAILKKYGDGTIIPFAGFKQFMISVLAVTDNKDDILAAFKLINRGDEVAKKDRLEFVMSIPDVEYFTSTAEKQANGDYNYKSWTEKVFAR